MRWGAVLARVARLVLRRVPAADAIEVVVDLTDEIVTDLGDEPTPLTAKDVAHIRAQEQAATKGSK